MPGALTWLLLLFAVLVRRGGVPEHLRTTSNTLLQHLMLLLVPATTAVRAKEYMAAHLSEPICLLDMAHTVGLSPCYFLRAFKRATGMPPHSYLYQLRLDHARGLLRRGVPPAQVAAELGFTDQNHLTRRFKAAFGVTPGQYARAP